MVLLIGVLTMIGLVLVVTWAIGVDVGTHPGVGSPNHVGEEPRATAPPQSPPFRRAA